MREENFSVMYDEEDDILSIYNSDNKSREFLEISDFISLGIDKNEGFSYLEIHDASNFFKSVNEKVNKEFLKDLKSAKLRESIFRGMFILAVILKSKGLRVEQSLPLMSKNELKGPLLQFIGSQ